MSAGRAGSAPLGTRPRKAVASSRPSGLRSGSLRELQNLYEAILDVKLDRRNFRKKFFSMDLLEDTGEHRRYGAGGGRPATIYRFRTSLLEITDQFAVLRPPTIAS